jgi:hypothetical protein
MLATRLIMLAVWATETLREKREKLPAISLVIIPAELQCLEKFLAPEDIDTVLPRS